MTNNQEEGVQFTANFIGMMMSTVETSTADRGAEILGLLSFLGLPKEHCVEAFEIVKRNLKGFERLCHMMPGGEESPPIPRSS